MVNKGLIKLDDPIEKYPPYNVTVPQYNGHKITRTFSYSYFRVTGLCSLLPYYGVTCEIAPDGTGFYEYNFYA